MREPTKLIHHITTTARMACGSPTGDGVWCTTDLTVVTCPKCLTRFNRANPNQGQLSIHKKENTP